MKINKNLALGLLMSVVSCVILFTSIMFFDSPFGNMWLSTIDWTRKTIYILIPIVIGLIIGIQGIKFLSLALLDTLERSD